MQQLFKKKKLTDIYMSTSPNFLQLTTMSDLILPMLQVGTSLPRLSSLVFVTCKSISKQGDIQLC